MKRDWDLIRKILSELEALGDTSSYLRSENVAGWDGGIVSYHMQMMIDAGLAKGSCSTYINGGMECHLISMTWEGHEFFDKIRSQSTWNSVKKIASEKGLSLSFEVVKLAAGQAIKAMF